MNTDTIAWIFPGQGSQHPGMGRDLAEAHPAARAVFVEADQVLGRSLSRLCFGGSEEELRDTANTQPALYTVSCAVTAALRAEGFGAAMAAGHSLGEFSALCAAGAIDFASGLRLVDLRGRLMARAGHARPGAMAAILMLAPEKVEDACRAAAEAGIVKPANFNSPQQVVISGEAAAVERAMDLAKAAGAKQVVRLNVAGAFHSPLMEDAVAELREELAKTVISPPRIRFAANVTAGFLEDPEAIRENLALQITSPVRWTESVQAMAAAGAARFVEAGPGGVLTGLLKRIDKSLRGFPCGTAEELAGLREKLAGAEGNG